MINELTRWQFSEFDNCLEISHDGDLLDFDEVKELFLEQEKKTNILLEALENIIKEMEYCGYADDCLEDCRPYGYCIFCRSKRALEEYKKE